MDRNSSDNDNKPMVENNTETNPPKVQMSDEERLELSKKLDADLETFIQSLEKRRYNEAWPEDRWEEEMNKHPFFMKQAPQPGDELSPLMEGLQKLKYDPEENTPLELANSYKEDGNFNFKHKNYRLAIMSYTEGLKTKCNDDKINATLLNNRSAAQFHLENYRSSLKDCESALKLDDKYLKTLTRAALCCFKLREFDRCIIYCDAALHIDAANNEMAILRKKASEALKIKQRDTRKRDKIEKKQSEEETKLLNEIKARGIRAVPLSSDSNYGSHSIHLSDLEPICPEMPLRRVHVDAISGALVWPVIFFYPEYSIRDYIQEFDENATFIDQLTEMFGEFPEWDAEKKYELNKLNVYFESIDKKLIQIDIQLRLRDVQRNSKFIVKQGTPSFIIFSRDSPAEKHFLKTYE